MSDLQIQLNSTSSILIVDDNMNNLQVLGSILHESGFNVIVARDGESALKNAEKRVPDLILLDIMMPEMDGYEVCRRLRDRPETQFTPIIFLSAKQETDSIVQGFTVGGNDYITKPFIKDELLARIRNQLLFSKANKNLHEMIRAKDRFFQIIAHDLKTPVNAQINFADLLQNNLGTFDENKVKSFVKMIYDTAVDQYKLLENLLEWTRIQSGMLSAQPEDFAIAELVSESIQLHRTIISYKNINLIMQLDTQVTVRADKKMIDTVVRNIVANATKFTQENGEIKVLLSLENANVRLEIADTGIGMTEEQQAELFKVGVAKVADQSNTSEKGTGIGLILSKEFIDLNNGSLEVVSELGKGTSFVINLPKA